MAKDIPVIRRYLLVERAVRQADIVEAGLRTVAVDARQPTGPVLGRAVAQATADLTMAVLLVQLDSVARQLGGAALPLLIADLAVRQALVPAEPAAAVVAAAESVPMDPVGSAMETRHALAHSAAHKLGTVAPRLTIVGLAARQHMEFAPRAAETEAEIAGQPTTMLSARLDSVAQPPGSVERELPIAQIQIANSSLGPVTRTPLRPVPRPWVILAR